MEEQDINKILERYETFAPLLNEHLDAFERRRQRAQIIESSGLSERTLRRYIQTYKEKGYQSLVDVARSDKGKARAAYGECRHQRGRRTRRRDFL